MTASCLLPCCAASSAGSLTRAAGLGKGRCWSVFESVQTPSPASCVFTSPSVVLEQIGARVPLLRSTLDDNAASYMHAELQRQRREDDGSRCCSIGGSSLRLLCPAVLCRHRRWSSSSSSSRAPMDPSLCSISCKSDQHAPSACSIPLVHLARSLTRVLFPSVVLLCLWFCVCVCSIAFRFTNTTAVADVQRITLAYWALRVKVRQQSMQREGRR